MSYDKAPNVTFSRKWFDVRNSLTFLTLVFVLALALTACGGPTLSPAAQQAALPDLSTAQRLEIVVILITPTPLPSDELTATLTATASATAIPTRTATATNLPTSATPTRTATMTRTPRPPTATRTATRIPAPPTATATAALPTTPPATATEGTPLPPARFYNADSIWNQPIAADAPTHPQSATWIRRIANEPYIDLIIDGAYDNAWSVVVYWLGTNTTTRRVCSDQGGYCENVPFPADWRGASPDGDGKAVFVDVNNQLAWSFWRLVCQSATACTAGYGAYGWHYTDTRGDGLTSYDGGAWGGRAGSWPYLPGLIMHEEAVAGVIPHALAIILPGQLVNGNVWPAIAGDGYCDAADCLPMGSRLQLLMTDAELDALNLSDAARAAADAMRVYGAWVGDTGSQMGINAQTFLDGAGRFDGSPWRGILAYGSLMAIPIDAAHWRVVQVNRDDFYTLPNPREVR